MLNVEKVLSKLFHLLAITGRMSGSKLCELLEPTRNVGIIYTAITIASEMAMFCVPSEFIKKHWFLVLWLSWMMHMTFMQVFTTLVLINQFWQLRLSSCINSNINQWNIKVFVWLWNFSAFFFSAKCEVLFPERLVLQSPQAIKTQNTAEYCAVDDGLKQSSQQESKVSIL